jgi:hypothetical protein
MKMLAKLASRTIFIASGKMSKKDTPINAPAAKAKKYFTGKLLFLSTKSPPMSVEKKVTPTKNNGRINANIIVPRTRRGSPRIQTFEPYGDPSG